MAKYWVVTVSGPRVKGGKTPSQRGVKQKHALWLAGRAPLHYAAMHGRLGAIEALVKAGALVNRKDVQGGFTPMHLAADAGQCEAMEALLRHGASVDPRSAQGWTPLGLATLKVLCSALYCMTGWMQRL